MNSDKDHARAHAAETTTQKGKGKRFEKFGPAYSKGKQMGRGKGASKIGK